MSVDCATGRGAAPFTPRPLRVLDLTLPTAAENLALEEAIVEGVDAGSSPPTLRFWSSPTPFVVLGVGQRAAQETNQEACERDGVPVLRRCSAGGCVLQGPGCLNYALFLTYKGWPEVRDLRASYCAILGRLCETLAARGIQASIEGTSDLVHDGKKFSGNAQKRKRDAVLHHGTLLYGYPDNLQRYIREPEERPGYRGARTHSEFVGPLALTPSALKDAVREAFIPSAGVGGTMLAAESELTEKLATEKYGQSAWNLRR